MCSSDLRCGDRYANAIGRNRTHAGDHNAVCWFRFHTGRAPGARRRLSIQARSSVLITGGGGCVSSINRSYLTGAKQASASRTCIIAPCPARGAGLNVERGAGCRCAAQSSRRRWWTPDAGRRAGTPDAGHPRHRSLVALVRHRRRSGLCTADGDAH